MNLIDKFASAISPAWALERRRAQARLDRMNNPTAFWRQAARASESRAMSGQSLDHPESRQNQSDRITLMREARWVADNNSVVKSILDKMEQFVIGRLSYMPRTDDREANREIKAYIELWMRHADWTNRHHFRKLAGLALKSMTRDGDCGFAIHEDNDLVKLVSGISPIRLQGIEADRIGSQYSTDWRFNVGHVNGSAWKLGENERDFSGVVVDRNGRPDRYRLYARRNDTASVRYEPDVEIPADFFIHLFRPNRLDAYRGVTAFDTAINDIKDAMEILGCEKVTVKTLSAYSGIVTNSDGTIDQDVGLDDAHPSYDANAERLKTIQPGTIQYIAAGEDFKAFISDRPSSTFNGFIDTLVRLTGLAVNLPFGFVYSWAGQGTAVRMEAAQADREFQQLQLTLEERLLDPIVQRVIARGIQLGHLRDVKGWDRGEWRYPAKVTADVGRESSAMIEENMSGHISKTQVAQDRGEDHELTESLIEEEAMRLIERAKRLVAASGGELNLQQAMFMLERRAPNMPADAAPEPEPEPQTVPPNGDAGEDE